MSSGVLYVNLRIEEKSEIMIPYVQLHQLRKVAKRLSHQRQYTPVHFQAREQRGQQVL